MNSFDKTTLKTLPLSLRESKSSIEDIIVNPDSTYFFMENDSRIEHIAREIVSARQKNKPVILAYGAHLIKNGLGLVLRKMIEEDMITHLATNGAGSIHDWEFSFQGKTEEDVQKAVSVGQFGLWEETGKYLNLAIISGAERGIGYGESVCEMIHNEKLVLSKIKNDKLKKCGIKKKDILLPHPYKQYSVQDASFGKIPFTVHPCFGQDIIYTHPLNDGASIGKCAEIDFLKFTDSISKLEKGVYLSVGSAIMSPMIFEKSLSMARNVAIQRGETINDFMIAVNDIQEGKWDWSKGEPPKNNPAYYLRFCKTFYRMGARELHYIKEDNKKFILSLYHSIKKIKNQVSSI
jgi:hypothetical protein